MMVYIWQCNNVFNQYLRLLVAGLNTDELVAMLPSFIRLYKDFGVSWDLAYHIIRPQLHRSIYVSEVLPLAVLACN